MQHSPRFLALIDAIRPTIKEITAHDLSTQLATGSTWLLLDVREASEYACGHIPQAISLSKGVLERDIEALAPDPLTEIVVYCSGGFRSALAAHNLQAMGYQRVRSLSLGSRNWQALGLRWE